MSSNTRPPDLAPAARVVAVSARHTAGIRVLLAVAYVVLSHLASDRNDGTLATLAVGDIVLIALLQPLLLPRAWAWALVAACVALLVALAHSRFALMPLMLVPSTLIGLVAYGFGRTLVHGRVPLITRMVAGLDAIPASALAVDLRDYTRHLTQAWAVLLAVLALLNLVLAAIVVPNGMLAMLGIASPLPVSQTHVSWLGGAANLGIMGGFFLVEFTIRQRRFPGRYHNLLDFMQQMRKLGPEFWRDVMH
jgi:uncharacterized membrane protein